MFERLTRTSRLLPEPTSAVLPPLCLLGSSHPCRQAPRGRPPLPAAPSIGLARGPPCGDRARHRVSRAEQSVQEGPCARRGRRAGDVFCCTRTRALLQRLTQTLQSRSATRVTEARTAPPDPRVPPTPAGPVVLAGLGGVAGGRCVMSVANAGTGRQACPRVSPTFQVRKPRPESRRRRLGGTWAAGSHLRPGTVSMQLPRPHAAHGDRDSSGAPPGPGTEGWEAGDMRQKPVAVWAAPRDFTRGSDGPSGDHVGNWVP